MTTDRSAHQAYTRYLALDELLATQRPNTDQHDELLFVVVHQAHELWFKQLLHELAELQRCLSAGHGGPALRTLHRVIAVVRVLIDQIDVLQTLTPGQFNGYRDQLGGSGFFSAQFREIEIVLGRRDPGVVDRFPGDSTDRVRLGAALERPAVFDSFLDYLRVSGFPVPDDHTQAEVRLVVRKARGEDGVPAQVCERLVDLDQTFQQWRYRHATLARRIIGDKTGTGGSTGAEYLRSLVFLPLFPDLWDAG